MAEHINKEIIEIISEDWLMEVNLDNNKRNYLLRGEQEYKKELCLTIETLGRTFAAVGRCPLPKYLHLECCMCEDHGSIPFSGAAAF